MPNNPEWPRGKANGAGRNAPIARYLIPDGCTSDAYSLAGPLRTGTSPDVGPRAKGPTAPGRTYDTDFGTDRGSPHRFDPIGTSLDRYAPKGIATTFTTRQVRRPRTD